MAIPIESEKKSSKVYDAMNPNNGKTIFNLIVSILLSTIKGSRMVSPTADQQGNWPLFHAAVRTARLSRRTLAFLIAVKSNLRGILDP